MEIDKELIREIVTETIKELKRSGILKDFQQLAYAEASSILSAYYNDGETDSEIRKVIESMNDDQYIKIIPLYFSYGYTLEQIAEVFDVEVSTVTRNKKRLCLEIYNQIQ